MTNHIALVTGGSRGIGKHIALELGRRGIDLVLTYRSSKGDADAVVEQLKKLGRRAAALQLDVGQTASFGEFRSRLASTLETDFASGRFQHLVHNGASGGGGAFADTTEAVFDRVMAEHFKGPFFLTQTLLPLIADGGRIVHITTGLTRYTVPGVSVYASAKGALEVLTHSLALELAPRRITVNSVAPGGVETDFNGGSMKEPGLQRMVIEQTPLGRMATPEDISGVVGFVLSDASRWMTGQRIELTGGFRL